MNICNHGRFSSKCIKDGKKYYFFDNIQTINNQLALTYCFFDGGKWRSDIAYLTNYMFAKELFNYAIKHELVNEMPKLMYDTDNTLSIFKAKAKEEFSIEKNPARSVWESSCDHNFVLRTHIDTSITSGFYCEIESNGYNSMLIVSYWPDPHCDAERKYTFHLDKLSNLNKTVNSAVDVLEQWGLGESKEKIEKFLDDVRYYLT